MSPNSGPAPPLDVGVLIAAAGRGERAGGSEPKQFRSVGGIPMLLRAIRPFARHPRVREIVVALPEPSVADPPEWIGPVVGERLRLTPGGETRAASVRAALSILSEGCTIVLVHDAARPFVPTETVDAVIAAVGQGVAVVPALPVSDTIKRVAAGTTRVVETVDRLWLWRAQTPQGFPRSMLESAVVGSSATYTDEAALVEAAGFTVEIVPGRATNLKVTTEEDFQLAEYLAGA